MAAMKHIAGGFLRQRSRRRCGRRRRRREERYQSLAGHDWWEEVGSWRPLSVASKMWQDMADGNKIPRGIHGRGQFSHS